MAAKEKEKEKAAEEISFETAMERLEDIVGKLESGDVPLETAIELFQEGMKLSQLCGSKLEQVERKIEVLIESENGLQRKPFAPANEDKGD
ncbi:exodeoxyribonuclease VII small subunit [Paenibacillus sacheonensis]|uniref:Exodeoxyribonuclease 7 small subunit n=1 Tax=Paenibacillus sacheonensis TaxID=742054 RepID=A0A7X5C109_9BACL|nr:exodeoxyribonuclease VII small subunit [Paenibacillus sacheonensis]MBM7564381.1 exodeoxyribonuclease VII small subunit [Paenibacillus sacheonensis]NBC68944.1 exodeoxyribonuclease VII small subunit [Paenibacillus sacheonensis]